MGKATNKVPVSERALVQRLNRRLHEDEQVLRRGRDQHGIERCWNLINWRINGVVEFDVDLEELGREVGVLKGYESLVDE